MQDGMNKHKQCERCHKGDVLQQRINDVLPSSFQYAILQYAICNTAICNTAICKNNKLNSVLMIPEMVFNIITRIDKKAFDLSVSTYLNLIFAK